MAKKIKKRKAFLTAVFVVIVCLLALHLVTTNKNKQVNPLLNMANDVTGDVIGKFELIESPLIVDKYIPDKSWKLIKTKYFKVYVPDKWITQTWSENSSVGICQSKIDCQDWQMQITTEKISYGESLDKQALEIERYGNIISGYKRTRREILLPEYKGMLLGDSIVVLNVEEGKITPVIYLDTKNDLYLKILSTLEIY